jgi:hypothetical protein
VQHQFILALRKVLYENTILSTILPGRFDAGVDIGIAGGTAAGSGTTNRRAASSGSTANVGTDSGGDSS